MDNHCILLSGTEGVEVAYPQASEITIVVRINAPGVEKTATRVIPLMDLMSQQDGPLFSLNGAFQSALGQVLPELF